MATMNGWIFVIIGVATSGISMWNKYFNDSDGLMVFQYIGFIFVAYGVAKLVIKFLLQDHHKTKNNHEKLKKLRQTHQQQQLAKDRQRLAKQQQEVLQQEQRLWQQEELKNLAQQQKEEPIQQKQPAIKTCPHCGLKNARYETICERCGSQI